MEAEQTPPPAPPQTPTVQPKLAVIQEARFAQNSPGIVFPLHRTVVLLTLPPLKVSEIGVNVAFPCGC